MPYRISYKPVASRPNEPWAIINIETGEIVGRSSSKEKAEGAVRARLAAEHNPSFNKKLEVVKMELTVQYRPGVPATPFAVMDETGRVVQRFATRSEAEAFASGGGKDAEKSTVVDAGLHATQKQKDTAMADHGEAPRHKTQPGVSGQPNVPNVSGSESGDKPAVPKQRGRLDQIPTL